ncbi:MAG: N-acetylglucosamine-6-phosphate deacetylase [Pirellulaceae bacterium]|nr:MAG: N-acetylglucosamine-6-phosphate deacetylase [Pirellulaceae bacterium]
MPALVARRYDTGRPVRICWDNGRLGVVEPASESAESLPWVAPGWVDIQINGYGGREYTNEALTVDDVVAIDRQLATAGVVRYCPTLTTHSFSTLAHAAGMIAKACGQDALLDAGVLGIHLEGPYISPHDGPRGAHPKPFCKAPDWDEFQRLQEAAEGRIRLVTLSPEYPNACHFIEQLVAQGITVAIGHTAASVEQIRQAVSAGARLSTHLGNGCHLELPRHPNYIWEQLAEDRLWASLIVDGHHLPETVVRCFVRAKQPERCILVSDITALGGMPPGLYHTSLGDVEILDDGRMVVAGQRRLLAGAARPIGDGIVNVMRFAGVDLATAIRMACHHPLRLLGRDEPYLEAGEWADLVCFDLPAPGEKASPVVLAMVRHGVVVYQQRNVVVD